MGGVSAPLYSNFRAFHKTGFAEILSFSMISFNLPGFCCVRVCFKYQLIWLLATRLIYQLRFVTGTRCFSIFYTTCVNWLPLFDRPETLSPFLQGPSTFTSYKLIYSRFQVFVPSFRGISVSEIRFFLRLHLRVNLLEASGAPPFPSGVSRSLKLDSFVHLSRPVTVCRLY